MRKIDGSWLAMVAASACLTACAVMGCSAEPDGATTAPAEALRGNDGEPPIVGWAIDSSALGQVPALTAPNVRSSREAFEPGRVQRELLRVEEPFEPRGQVASRSRFESSTFALELDAAKGKLLALRKDARRAATGVIDEDALGRDARDRVRALGIPDEEVAGAVTRKLLGQDDTRAGSEAAPRLVAYKTFVSRGFGGVRVEGHRAVISHDPDGSLRKVLVQWPALAATGHRLRTPLGLAEITRAAATQLAALGRPQGQAKLSWVQTPSVDESGAVRLTLQVAARLPAIDRGEITEEPEIELIDVSAVE